MLQALRCWRVGRLPMILLLLSAFLTAVRPAEIVPGADRFGPIERAPPVAPAFAGDRLVGYAFVNADWMNATGYSGRPIEILIGLSVDGKITGAKLMDHHEPIVLIGIPPERIAAFIQGHVGADVREIAQTGLKSRPQVDIVSGATVTVMVIGDSIIRSGIAVARAEGLIEGKRRHERERRHGAVAAPEPSAS